MEGPDGLTGSNGFIRALRLLPRPFFIERYERMKDGIQLMDQTEVSINYIKR